MIDFTMSTEPLVLEMVAAISVLAIRMQVSSEETRATEGRCLCATLHPQAVRPHVGRDGVARNTRP